jgi:hypothetical protein
MAICRAGIPVGSCGFPAKQGRFQRGDGGCLKSLCFGRNSSHNPHTASTNSYKKYSNLIAIAIVVLV